MRLLSIVICFGLTGCAAPSFDLAKPAEAHGLLSAHEIVLNRPNTDRAEAVLDLQADGRGTVDFLGTPDGAQDVTWHLTGDRFCMDAQDGLMAHFDCARLAIDGMAITLAHTQSDSVVTGVLRPR